MRLNSQAKSASAAFVDPVAASSLFSDVSFLASAEQSNEFFGASNASSARDLKDLPDASSIAPVLQTLIDSAQ